MRAPVVIFPDAELFFTGFTRDALSDRPEPYTSGVRVDNKTPNPRADRMVSFRRDGGPRLDMVREVARLGINVWGRTEQEVTDLARLVGALVGASADGMPVISVSQNGPSPVPDESGQPRRFFTIEAVMRGVQLAP